MIFKNKTPNFNKLLQYGFQSADGKYAYSTDILDGEFKLTVTIDGNGAVETELLDVSAQDVYTLHLVATAVGAYVGRVRAEYEAVLQDISDKCFEKDVFKQDYSRQVIRFASETYGDEPEYLWDKFPECAVLRRKDNNKWYALLITVARNKLGFDSNEIAEVLDLRFDPTELPLKVDGKKYFLGYHMNKKHWITIILDGSVPIDEIFDYIKQSYLLAK